MVAIETNDFHSLRYLSFKQRLWRSAPQREAYSASAFVASGSLDFHSNSEAKCVPALDGASS